MNEFLRATEYCDSKDPEIVSVGNDFLRRYPDQTERAIRLFYLVRDSIDYTVGNWRKKASETMRLGHGTCTNNANLLVALCRATGIPAGYGVMEVVGPEYFGNIIPPRIAKTVSKKSKHIYCFVFISGRWIKCDPSDDEPLSINTQHLNPQSNIVEWNGIDHAILNLHPSHIISDRGPIANIDHIINKKQRRIMTIPIMLGNTYISFLRHNGKTIDRLEDLEPEFEKWLKRNHFTRFLIAEIFFFFHDIMMKIKKS